jgi:DNA-directed RNA polymerase specialized sigma24 family protein
VVEPDELRPGPDDTAVVRGALRALSAVHLEILNETVLGGCTVNQAAVALEIPVAAVKSRVYYALRAFRITMAERTGEQVTSAPSRIRTCARDDQHTRARNAADRA